jgi:hypothetical protein
MSELCVTDENAIYVCVHAQKGGRGSSLPWPPLPHLDFLEKMKTEDRMKHFKFYD